MYTLVCRRVLAGLNVHMRGSDELLRVRSAVCIACGRSDRPFAWRVFMSVACVTPPTFIHALLLQLPIPIGRLTILSVCLHPILSVISLDYPLSRCLHG